MPSTEVRPDRMEDSTYFEEAIKDAFEDLRRGRPNFVFKKDGYREEFFTDFMKEPLQPKRKKNWQGPSWNRPSKFKSLKVGMKLKGKHLGPREREVDFIRIDDDGKDVASCELKVYLIRTLEIGKAFTMLSEAVLKQMIRQDSGIEAIPYVAVILRSTIEMGGKIATIEDFNRVAIDNCFHRYLRVKCSKPNKTVPLGEHSLFIWRICCE